MPHRRLCLSLTLLVAAAIAVTAVHVIAQQTPPEIVDLLDGLDPVELVAGRELPGREALAVTHRGYRYLFASAENAATFKKNPARYEPVNGGTCARMGAGGPGNPSLFTVFDGRIYLFASESCRKQFDAGPHKFLFPAIDRVAPSEDVRAKGLAIVARAVQAMGGAARLNALTGYLLERQRLRGTPQGPQTIPERVTVLFPDGVRVESRAPQATMLVAASKDDTFMAMTRGTESRVMRFPEAPRAVVAHDLMQSIVHYPIGLLHERHAGGVVIAAVETPADTSRESVRITIDDMQAVLAIARDTGLPSTLTYPARTRDGTVSPLTLSFSDYRSIDGLQVPFLVDAHFATTKVNEESYVVTSWSANPTVSRSELMRETMTPAVPK